MGSLLAMPLLKSDPAERPLHDRIQTRSRFFALLFTALLGLSVLLLAVMVGMALFYTGDHVFADSDGMWIGNPPKVPPTGFISFGSLPPRLRIGGVFALVAQFAPAIMVLANLRGLFRLYAGGTVLARENAVHIKHIGLWLLAYAVAPCLSVEFLTVIDCVVDRNWFHLVEVQAFVLGGILLVIAQVMEAGREIELDRSGFI